MSPNKQISEKKKKEIPKLCERFNRGYVAKKLGICVDTVKKYEKESENI
jgi:hypothetical protein